MVTQVHPALRLAAQRSRAWLRLFPGMSQLASVRPIPMMDTREAVEKPVQLDAPALARVQAVCNFVNGETARQRNMLIGIAIASVVVAMLIPLLTGLHDARVLFLLVAGTIGFFFVRARQDLASAYEKVAITRVVTAVSRELAYRAKSSLTREVFLVSDLFNGVEKWNSRDEIIGRAGDLKFSLHRVRAAGADRKADVFDGVIVKVDAATVFPGHTLVIAEGAKLPHGSRVRRDVVLLNHPTFEERFNVFSTDYHEARRILSPAMMDVIMDTAAHFDKNMRLAFTQKSAFLAIPGGDALRVNASLFGPKLTPQTIAGRLVTLVGVADRLARALAQAE
jgi:hypothetical protein